jgi:hypothetical protein
MFMLNDVQMKNRDNGESNHCVIAVYNLQNFLYNVSKNMVIQYLKVHCVCLYVFLIFIKKKR